MLPFLTFITAMFAAALPRYSLRQVDGRLRLNAIIEPSWLIMPARAMPMPSGRAALPSIGCTYSGEPQALAPRCVDITTPLPSGVQYSAWSSPEYHVSCRRLAAGGRHDEHVVVAGAGAGERDPLAVRRKARREIARDVDREASRIRAVGVDQPDVVLIGERDAAVVGDAGIPRKANGVGRLGDDSARCAERERRDESEGRGGCRVGKRRKSHDRRLRYEEPEASRRLTYRCGAVRAT